MKDGRRAGVRRSRMSRGESCDGLVVGWRIGGMRMVDADFAQEGCERAGQH